YVLCCCLNLVCILFCQIHAEILLALLSRVRVHGLEHRRSCCHCKSVVQRHHFRTRCQRDVPRSASCNRIDVQDGGRRGRRVHRHGRHRDSCAETRRGCSLSNVSDMYRQI